MRPGEAESLCDLVGVGAGKGVLLVAADTEDGLENLWPQQSPGQVGLLHSGCGGPFNDQIGHG